MEAGAEGLGVSVQGLVVYFYTNDVLVVSPCHQRLQRYFDVVIYLFHRVVLQTNVSNTVSMACRPCHTPCGMLESVYKIRTTGVGPSYREGLRRRLHCPQYGVGLAAGSLLTHHQIQNGVVQGYQENSPPPPTWGGLDLSVLLPNEASTTHIPGGGCAGGA